MRLADNDRTSTTLLARLRDHPADAAAWEEFVRRYRPRIYSFCLAYPLQPADAEDVTQAVLLRLVEKMRAFHYDLSRSFRAWLQTVTRNVLCDYLHELRRVPSSGDSAVLRLLENLEAREGLARQIETDLDRELLEEALRRVRPRVSSRQWEAFRLTAVEGMPGKEAAEKLGMLVATVYTAKSKVQKLVRQEIGRLDGPVG